MPELLVVTGNPRRKHRKLSAKQIAAGFGGGRRKKRRHGRRRARRSKSRAAVPFARKRAARRTSRHSRGLRFGGFSPMGFVNDTLIPAGIGAAGALGVDATLNMLSPRLPAFLQTGAARTGVKLAAAVGLGMLVSMVAGRRFGEQVLAGAVTVTAYDFLKPYVAAAIPGVAGYGSDMGYWSPALQLPYPYVDSGNPALTMGDGMGAYVDGLGAYVDQFGAAGGYYYQ